MDAPMSFAPSWSFFAVRHCSILSLSLSLSHCLSVSLTPLPPSTPATVRQPCLEKAEIKLTKSESSPGLLSAPGPHMHGIPPLCLVLTHTHTHTPTGMCVIMNALHHSWRGAAGRSCNEIRLLDSVSQQLLINLTG